MAEIIQLHEIQAARDRARRRDADHAHLESAVTIMRDNLAAVAERIRSATEAEQPELLNRVEKLVVLIRYGMYMLDTRAADALGRQTALPSPFDS